MSLGAIRQPEGRAGACSCMAARAPAPARRIAASSIPRIYRIVDLRPARRRPLARRSARSRDNTTPHLIADIERLRSHLGIERWLRVRRLLGLDPRPRLCRGTSRALPGPGAARHLPLPQERDRLVPLRHARVFPEAWRDFAGYLPEAERGDLLTATTAASTDPDPAVHMPAARAWSVYEGACSTLLPSPETVAAFAQDARGARPRAHRGALLHARHLPAGELAAAITSTASATSRRVIVQGRYDMVCPIAHRRRSARAGRRPSTSSCPMPAIRRLEPGIRSALVAAMDRFRKLR